MVRDWGLRDWGLKGWGVIGKEILLIIDGTGFGYGSHCFVGWYRGKVTKKVRTHCKVLMVLGEKEGERMILRVKVEGSYADERGMFLEWLRRVREKIGEKVKFVKMGCMGKAYGRCM